MAVSLQVHQMHCYVAVFSSIVYLVMCQEAATPQHLPRLPRDASPSQESNRRRSDVENEPLPTSEDLTSPQDETDWTAHNFTYITDHYSNGTMRPLYHKCRLIPIKKRDHIIINGIIARHDTKLIEVHMHLQNSKLELDKGQFGYKTHRWSRVVTANGQTMLNLAFNFNVLSLMTLSFGVKERKMDVVDEPRGCVTRLPESDKIKVMLDLAIRDFNPGGDVAVIEDKSAVCHQIMRVKNGRAEFQNRCCSKKLDTNEIECYIDRPNKWLKVLDVLLAAIVAIIFVFGPLCVPEWIYAATQDFGEYVVKLKEPLYKNLVVSRNTTSASKIKAKHALDIRSKKDYKLCRRIIADIPSDMIVPIKISQFDVRVAYRKLLTEENVPVGLIECIARALFLCKIRDLDPFKDCCESSYLGCFQKAIGKQRRWIDPCNIIGRLALVLVLPIPFYIRLIMYYYFEHPEITDRTAKAASHGLELHHNYRLLQHLSPTHPVYVAAYVVYLMAGMAFAYCTTTQTETRFQRVIIDAFAELNDMSFLNVFAVVIKNLLLPFRKFGVFGCACTLLLWPVFLPISLIVIVLYCLPIVFVTCQILLWLCKGGHSVNKRRKFQDTVHKFEYEKMIRRVSAQSRDADDPCKGCYCGLNVRRLLFNTMVSSISLLAIYSVMLLTSEVMGFVLEVLCFTLMGLIVNAGSVLKYGSLIFLVIIYSYDTYSVVNKKYLKLNKSLFTEIRFRIKDIEEHTSLPSYLQENRGFKAVEASEQADYELTDDINDENPFTWNINDLILFIDRDDTPRIPRKLFDDTCQIQVDGTPGPVYRSLMVATAKFLAIILFLVFVFVVVMSFGDVYRISTTNQMLATLAGGFMPYIFRSLLRPGKAKIETDLLCFKSKLNEIIQNFCQTWPMYDFIFEVEEKPDTDNEEDGSDTDSCEKKSKKKDKKKDSRKSSVVSAMMRPAGSSEILDKDPGLIREKELAVKEQVEQMDLTPVEMNDSDDVDILIQVSDRDTGWEMEYSSIEDMNEAIIDISG